MYLVPKFCGLSSSLFSHDYHLNWAISSRDSYLQDDPSRTFIPALTYTIRAREDACQNAKMHEKDVLFEIPNDIDKPRKNSKLGMQINKHL